MKTFFIFLFCFLNSYNSLILHTRRLAEIDHKGMQNIDNSQSIVTAVHKDLPEGTIDIKAIIQEQAGRIFTENRDVSVSSDKNFFTLSKGDTEILEFRLEPGHDTNKPEELLLEISNAPGAGRFNSFRNNHIYEKQFYSSKDANMLKTSITDAISNEIHRVKDSVSFLEPTDKTSNIVAAFKTFLKGYKVTPLQVAGELDSKFFSIEKGKNKIGRFVVAKGAMYLCTVTGANRKIEFEIDPLNIEDGMADVHESVEAFLKDAGNNPIIDFDTVKGLISTLIKQTNCALTQPIENKPFFYMRYFLDLKGKKPCTLLNGSILSVNKVKFGEGDFLQVSLENGFVTDEFLVPLLADVKTALSNHFVGLAALLVEVNKENKPKDNFDFTIDIFEDMLKEVGESKGHTFNIGDKRSDLLTASLGDGNTVHIKDIDGGERFQLDFHLDPSSTHNDSNFLSRIVVEKIDDGARKKLIVENMLKFISIVQASKEGNKE